MKWEKRPSIGLFLVLFCFQSLSGSTDRNTVETQLLGTPVSALYIRILPLEVNGQAGLRFDVLGCTPDCKRPDCTVGFPR